MTGLKLIPVAVILFIGLVACGGGSDNSQPEPALKCTQPCIASSPVLSTQSISSATGGTLEVQLSLDKPAEKVYVVLHQYDFDCPNAGFLPGNTKYNLQADLLYTFAITVSAGMPLCRYYTEVVITPVEAEPNFGLFWRNRSDDTNYYYQEKIIGGGNEGNIIRTQFQIPVIYVTE